MTIIEEHFGIDMEQVTNQEMQETYYMILANADFCAERVRQQQTYMWDLDHSDLPQDRKRLLYMSALSQLMYFTRLQLKYSIMGRKYKLLTITAKQKIHLEYRKKLLPILIY